jgi:predicted TIM-barrel fold metal-dependent hydrolase
MDASTRPGPEVESQVDVKVVDTDVHPVPQTLDEFIEFYPEPYRSRYFTRYKEDVPLTFLLYTPHPNTGGGGMSGFALPPRGGAAGSDPEFLAQQLCVEAGTDYCILNPLAVRPRHWDAEWNAAHCAAINNWMDAVWLSGKGNAHGRFRASLQLSPMDPAAAAREIERWAGHPYFVQTYMLADSFVPFGDPFFKPLLEASARHDLPLATHLFRHPGYRSMTPVGFPSYHVEVLPNWIFTYISHVASMVFDGVFERHPNLKFMCVEGGCEWAAPMMWRLDRQWEEIGAEVPDVTKKPSELIRKHVRFATQPLCEPEGVGDLTRFMEWAGAEETIVYSSDYPHYDYDDAPWVANQLPAAWRDRVMAKNALEFYGMPETRPRDFLDDRVPGNRRIEAIERKALIAAAAAAAGPNAPQWIESTD